MVEEEKEEKGGWNWGWALIILGIIIIIVALVIFGVQRETNTTFWIVLGVGGVVLILGIIWALVIASREKKEKAKEMTTTVGVPGRPDCGQIAVTHEGRALGTVHYPSYPPPPVATPHSQVHYVDERGHPIGGVTSYHTPPMAAPPGLVYSYAQPEYTQPGYIPGQTVLVPQSSAQPMAFSRQVTGACPLAN